MQSKTKNENKESKNVQLLWTVLTVFLFVAIQTNRLYLPYTDQTQAPVSEQKTESDQAANDDPNQPVSRSHEIIQHPAIAPSPINTPQLNESAYRSTQKATVNDNQTITKNGKTYPLRDYKPMLVPNDTYASQWWVSSTGMNAAWDIPAGPKQIITAVIDTGFALNHQEFSGRWASNSGELGATTNENPSRLNCSDQGLPLNLSCNNIDDNFDGIVDNESGSTTKQQRSTLNCTDQGIVLNKNCNRVDDDGNGFADDYLGWDFINYDRSPAAGETNLDGSGTSHGTMVSGVMAASGNNGVGMAGVNWHTKILPIQALNDDSYGNSITVADAIYYAVDRGVDIINVSLGTSFEDPYLREAVLYAQEAGVLIVASSGNSGCNCIVYPANYPEVVAVGANNSSGTVSGFSSYGANLDMVAPGENMTTSYWSKNNQVSSYAGGVAGTSFASPFVSGVLGLLKSSQPQASWDELIGVLMENSDRKSLSAGSPRNDSYGFGFVRVNHALTRATSPFVPAIIYNFDGEILGPERIRACESNLIPGSFIYELSKSGQLRYTINQYEIRKAVNSGWASSRLFGVCVGLPTDTPDTLRLISLTQEIRNRLIK